MLPIYGVIRKKPHFLWNPRLGSGFRWKHVRPARKRRSHAVCLLPAPPSVSGEERRAAPPAGQLESRDQRGPTVIRPFKHDGVKTRAVGYVKGGTKPKKKKVVPAC